MGLSVGVAGLGAIGLRVARALDEGIEGLNLAAVSARDHDKAAAKLASLRMEVPVVALAELADHAEVVVECVPAAAFLEIATRLGGRNTPSRRTSPTSGSALAEVADSLPRASTSTPPRRASPSSPPAVG